MTTNAIPLIDEIQNYAQNNVDTVREALVKTVEAQIAIINSENLTQADRSMDRSEVGLGMALVQRPAEVHGEARGTKYTETRQRVYCAIAIVQGEILELPVVESEPRNARQLRVLVVDDNVDTVLSFSMLLRASGHEVQTAHDGPAAVQAAINYLPDIVLLDIGLPGLNGYEVAKQIRQHPELKHVVLVALTGYGQDSDRHASGQAGFTYHLVKPARFEELQKILATVAEQVA
ncbi:MAG: response regulator [Planctomycetaceae bacterium]